MRARILITAFIAYAIFMDDSAVGQAPRSSKPVSNKADQPFSLDAGDYLLRIVSNDAPKGDRDATSRASVTIEPPQKKVQKITLVMRRDKPPHTTEFRGIKLGNSIKLSASAIEGEEVFSMHLIGSMSNNNEVKGKITQLVDGEIDLRGEWTLKKNTEAAPKSK